MKKVLKWILIIFVVLLIGLFVATKIMSKSLPTGETGPAAEALTEKILDRLNKPAWDSLEYISWTFFRGEHHYVWDKASNKAKVSWGENEVVLDLDNLYERSVAMKKGGALLEGEDKKEAIETAWAFWCNDSFWLYAPYKLRDPGIIRAVVTQDNREGLLVTYQSGGTTPGDSYLWWVDDTGLPTSFDMWTSIIPIKGLNATWDSWQELPGGAMIAKSHSLGPIEMSMSNIKAGRSLESIGQPANLFSK